MIKSFGGLIISSKDPEALVKFYNESLGIPILTDNPSKCAYDGVELGFNKNETIIWVADENKWGKAEARFVLRCDDLDKTYTELKQKGVQLDHPGVAADGVKELVCKDLEGNAIIMQEQ